MPHYYMKTTCATHGGKTTPSSKERRQKERRRIKKKLVIQWNPGAGVSRRMRFEDETLDTIFKSHDYNFEMFFSSLIHSWLKYFNYSVSSSEFQDTLGLDSCLKIIIIHQYFKKKHVSQFKITVYLQIYTPRFLPFCHLNLQKELFVGLLRYSSDRGPNVRRHWFWRCRLWRIWEIENQLLLAEFKPDLGLTGFGFKPLVSWTSFIYLDQIFF